MNRRARLSFIVPLCLGAFAAACSPAAPPGPSVVAPAGSESAPPAASSGQTPAVSSAAVAAPALCPPFGWSEGLARFLAPDAKMPTEEPNHTVDCQFHEWSWEAFVWATALDKAGVPRFMTLPTPDDLVSSKPDAGKEGGVRLLRLASRSAKAHGTGGRPEVAGAIVEADSNMMVAQNGYPVLASVHMNASYFKTAKRNLIYDNGYQNNPNQDDYFEVGAAVFKATWMRLDEGQKAPAGAFTTQAEVPVLVLDKKTHLVTTSGKTTTATVALVGLHVVGVTVGHPEFLWGTFEQNLNSPAVPDNTFSSSGSDPKSYTFYTANTPFTQVNLPNNPATGPGALAFDEKSQRFSPVTQAVQENKTGGETNDPKGPENIGNLNRSSQGFLKGQAGNQAIFAGYSLIGTVWMKPNTYVTSTSNWQQLAAPNAFGSVVLANVTAETFVQSARDGDMSKVTNCFSCHNPTSFNFQPDNKLASRRVAISHALSVNAPLYAVANQIPVKN
jgi:hypothetical protein